LPNCTRAAKSSGAGGGDCGICVYLIRKEGFLCPFDGTLGGRKGITNFAITRLQPINN